MIKLINVSKTYDLGDSTSTVLSDINFSIELGEFVGILGTSGSGKSTLMHILGLLDSPSTGKVLINDQDISKSSDGELSHLRNEYVGFVFQQFNLINKLSVLENVLLPTLYTQKKEINYEKKALELLERFGILDRKQYFPNRISGGQQQRVAIARALIMSPQLILADEPTGNLDTKTGDEILNLLEELNTDLKVTIILVTHEKDVAARTKRQVFIRDGKIVDKYL